MDYRGSYDFEKMHDKAKEIIVDYFKENYPYPEEEIEYFTEKLSLYSFPQTWSSTACGFGGIAGQAITGAQTVAFFSDGLGVFVVFIAGRFAYMVEPQGSEVIELIMQHRLPGRFDASRKFKESKILKLGGN
jgi:uncharacterized membrane protein YtjA (UPF0391 family)